MFATGSTRIDGVGRCCAKSTTRRTIGTAVRSPVFSSAAAHPPLCRLKPLPRSLSKSIAVGALQKTLKSPPKPIQHPSRAPASRPYRRQVSIACPWVCKLLTTRSFLFWAGVTARKKPSMRLRSQPRISADIVSTSLMRDRDRHYPHGTKSWTVP